MAVMSGWAELSNHSCERRRRVGPIALVTPGVRARTPRRVVTRPRPLAILRPVILVSSPCARYAFVVRHIARFGGQNQFARRRFIMRSRQACEARCEAARA